MIFHNWKLLLVSSILFNIHNNIGQTKVSPKVEANNHESCISQSDLSTFAKLWLNVCFSSDDSMERPWKESKQKKYRQTTLNFHSSGASYAQVVSRPSSTKGRATKHQNPSGEARSFQTGSVTAGATGRITRQQIRGDGARFSGRMSDRDTENYRLGYPDQRDNPELNDNWRFYKGLIPSSPDGAYIDEIHDRWWGNFQLLERHHSYIQWIFPIREGGMNWQAQPLQPHEAQAIVADPTLHRRVLRSYEMMLNFYGMKLADTSTGRIQRARHWEDCYENLNFSSHNYLRITRILKSLGEFELEHLKKPWLKFILKEMFEHGELLKALQSMKNYWIGTIKNDADRDELHSYIEVNSRASYAK